MNNTHNLRKIDNLIQERLSAKEYNERLHEILRCGTKYRLSTILYNGTADWYEIELLALSELLEIEPIELLMNFGIGRKYITIERANELAKEQGYEVGLLAHVA